jgi:hypothetical protein
MSATPTTARLFRSGALIACATLALTPGAALAKKPEKDKAKEKGSPAVCTHDLPAGMAKKGGDLPHGIAKKVEGTGPPCDAPGGPRQGVDPAPAPQAPAPVVAAAAPVVTVAASSAPLPPCVSRRSFRLRLDRKGRVRIARVMLNGKAIAVTRGKSGRASVLIDLRKRLKGTYTVRTTVVTKKGKIVTGDAPLPRLRVAMPAPARSARGRLAPSPPPRSRRRAGGVARGGDPSSLSSSR